MEWARMSGVALVGLTALVVLRQYKPEWAPLLRGTVTVIALGMILSMAGTVIGYVRELAVGTEALSGESWSLLLKALGVAFLTETSAAVCRDSGEAGLATWVETAGKLEILLLSFPLIRTVMDMVAALLGQA